MPLALDPLDAGSLLATFGAAGVFLVMFAETGLLVGFFLPGDTLLFSAGLLCTTDPHAGSSTGAGTGIHLSLAAVLVASAAGALLGAQTGYLIGRRAGRSLVTRTRNQQLIDGVARAEVLLARYGHGKAIVLARFVPLVRTVLNPLAGMVGVPARVFVLWQAVGGVLWTVGLVMAGYALRSSVPDIDQYLLPGVAVVVVLSLVPAALQLLRSRRRPATVTAAPEQPEDHP